MGGFVAGVRSQVYSLTAYPDSLIPFLTAPLFTTIFMMVFKHAGRDDLTAYAAVAPIFISLWWLTLFNSGWTIAIERWNGTLELLVAAPSPLAAVALGRIATTTALGTVSFAETWLVARVIFGTRIVIEHWVAFAAISAITLAAMAGTAVAIASLFVLARNAGTWSTSASYPFYVLGGVLVPVSFLPAWLRPLSGAVFLSWSADLLRATMTPHPIHHLAPRLAMIALLGGCGFLVGAVAMRRVLFRVRETGELGSL